MSVHQTPDGRWYCQYYKPGTRKPSREYFGRGSKAKLEAEAWDKDYRLKKKKGRTLQEPAPKTASPTFNEIAMAYLTQKPLAPSTKKTIVYCLQNISEVFGHQTVEHLSMKDLLDLDATLVAKGRTIATRNRYSSYCRAIMNFGVKHGLAESNPFANFKPDRARENKAPDLVTDQELRAIWAAAPPHLQWVITCMLNLGVRPGRTELFAIKMSDVDFNQSGVWVIRTKTHSVRTLIPCRPTFLDQVKKLIETEPQRKFLVEYPEHPGQPITTLKTTWWNTLRRAGIYKINAPTKQEGRLQQKVQGQARRIRLYDLRHKFASMLMANGADIKATSEILGHSNTGTTMSVYYHLLERQKRSAIDLLEVPDLCDENSP